jgi:tetratricopeptide (TPR) repeat protein
LPASRFRWILCLDFSREVLISADAQQFVDIIRPLLETKNVAALTTALCRHWTNRDLARFLRCEVSDARKVALLAVGLVGTAELVNAVAEQLKNPDPAVNSVAEHSLWSIWFRTGKPAATHEVQRGVQALGRRETLHALEHFNKAIELDPNCPEAYNQRGLAYYMLQESEKCIDECALAIERMPCHFAAWASMGNAYVNLCIWPKAIECYRQALDINPHLQSIQNVIEELQLLESS